MDSEEKRRNDAELAAAEAKAKAEAAKASAPSDPFLAATSSTGSSFPFSSPKDTGSSSGGYVSNRADKYLPQLPVMAHQEMGRDRMREIEAWHSFLEMLSSRLALQDEAYVNEIGPSWLPAVSAAAASLAAFQPPNFLQQHHHLER